MRAHLKGFSLVELMIVVAIIGIMAAVAVPNFVALQLKAKRAELPGNLNGIRTAQIAYEAAYEGYIDCAENPGHAAVGKTQQAWNLTAAGWADLGWSPDGLVRGSYEVVAGATDFTATGVSDLDADRVQATFQSNLGTKVANISTAEGIY